MTKVRFRCDTTGGTSGGADRCEWGNGESWKNGRGGKLREEWYDLVRMKSSLDNSGLVYSSFDASTVCPPSGSTAVPMSELNGYVQDSRHGLQSLPHYGPEQ